MIKDAAVGGLLKAAGMGHRGDLGVADELFVKIGLFTWSTPCNVRGRGQRLSQEEPRGGPEQPARLSPRPAAPGREVCSALDLRTALSSGASCF
ncbi:hypothetical protein NN561_000032 [Cricetulus griseus]